MRRSKIPLPFTTLLCKSTTATFWPMTPWMDASQVGSLRFTLEIRCLEGDQEISGAYQTANVENSPDSAVAVGSYANSNGMSYGSSFTDVSANTQPKQLVRLGCLVKNTSTSNTTWSRVAGSVDILDMQ